MDNYPQEMKEVIALIEKGKVRLKHDEFNPYKLHIVKQNGNEGYINEVDWRNPPKSTNVKHIIKIPSDKQVGMYLTWYDLKPYNKAWFIDVATDGGEIEREIRKGYEDIVEYYKAAKPYINYIYEFNCCIKNDNAKDENDQCFKPCIDSELTDHVWKKLLRRYDDIIKAFIDENHIDTSLYAASTICSREVKHHDERMFCEVKQRPASFIDYIMPFSRIWKHTGEDFSLLYKEFHVECTVFRRDENGHVTSERKEMTDLTEAIKKDWSK